MYDLYKQKSHQIFQRVFHENTFEIKKKKGNLDSLGHCVTICCIHAKDFKFNTYLLNFYCLLSAELGVGRHFKF